MVMNLSPQITENMVENQKRVEFNTGPYRDPPLFCMLQNRVDNQRPEKNVPRIRKNQKLKEFGLRHVLSWLK